MKEEIILKIPVNFLIFIPFFILILALLYQLIMYGKSVFTNEIKKSKRK